jgi:hypothetical protein
LGVVVVSLLETKKTIEEILLQREEVIGIGADEQTQHIRVYVLESDDGTIPDIPKMMAGFPIDVISTPGFATISSDPDFRERRFRPVVGGVSAAHTNVTAGTLGAVIRDKKTGNKLFLSNNHVFSNTSSKTNSRAHIGDAIIQPSPSDGGTITDTIAKLYKWVPFIDGGTNIVDAALAMPVDQSIASPYILSDADLDVISINGIRSVTSPIKVKKYGRTSGADFGKIIDLNFTVAVDYDDGLTRNFVDQILVEIETRGGDSGSILLDMDANAVGLVFAGGIDKSGTFYGVANKIKNVLSMLSDEEIDIMDGWSPSQAMMESPPQFEADAATVEEPRAQDNTIRNILIAGAGIAAAAVVWKELNTREY